MENLVPGNLVMRWRGPARYSRTCMSEVISARPRTTPRPALPSLASRKNRVLWAFFAILKGPVNQQQLSVTNTWLPKCISEHHPLVNTPPFLCYFCFFLFFFAQLR